MRDKEAIETLQEQTDMLQELSRLYQFKNGKPMPADKLLKMIEANQYAIRKLQEQTTRIPPKGEL